MTDSKVVQKFSKLKEIWLRETIDYNNIRHIISHPAYEDIIEMGEEVLPLIIDELRDELEAGNGFNMWFFALHKITMSNPITGMEWSKQEAMARKWIQWFEEMHSKAEGTQAEHAV